MAVVLSSTACRVMCKPMLTVVSCVHMLLLLQLASLCMSFPCKTRWMTQSVLCWYRDIKPENILLDCSLKAKVGDVGLARLAPAGPGATVRHRFLAGTTGYMDPEYISSLTFSTKSDVYALGRCGYCVAVPCM